MRRIKPLLLKQVSFTFSLERTVDLLSHPLRRCSPSPATAHREDGGRVDRHRTHLVQKEWKRSMQTDDGNDDQKCF